MTYNSLTPIMSADIGLRAKEDHAVIRSLLWDLWGKMCSSLSQDTSLPGSQFSCAFFFSGFSF